MGMTVRVGRNTLQVPDRVFLDANLIIDYLVPGQYHRAATLMMGQLMNGAVRGLTSVYVSPLVLDEVWWKLAVLRYARARKRFPTILPDWNDGTRMGRAGRKRVFRKYGAYLAAKTNDVLQRLAPVNVVSVDARDIPVALGIMARQSGSQLPRDALHLAVMQRHRITGIATNDRDFTNVPGIVALPFVS